MHLRRGAGEGAFEGGERQALVKAAAQMPAARATREDIHEHGVDELLTQADVDVGDPDLGLALISRS